MKIHCFDTIIVGSGASGFAAADRLWSFGQKNIAIITESINLGTSRNAGSDKQTYYKLTLSGGMKDSIDDMTQTLFEGGCVDGDHALCEAALSTRAFMHLVDLGVDFPCNYYGEYVGYKTDNDPKMRATSAGPYTSRMMTEALQNNVEKKQVPIFNHLMAIKILKIEEQACGLLCLDLSAAHKHHCEPYVAFHCKNIIWATGGPAAMYENVVYPVGQNGSTGVAFEAGAVGQNLTEWQYGLSSIKPRWNVSGTYMQALPRFYSTDSNCNEHDFLSDYFSNRYEMLSLVFLKGYQWPFDSAKVLDGSSIIDILVFLEIKKGRRVWLDYKNNPFEKINYSSLSEEAYRYLKNAGACLGTPIDRLKRMNSPAIQFYKKKGVDLAKAPLEITLSAQHNNGGLSVNCWWETSVPGLFAIGECSSTHGIYRPGGSALNAGQVGAIRAAQCISAQKNILFLSEKDWLDCVSSQISDAIMPVMVTGIKRDKNFYDNIKYAQHRMTRSASAFRNPREMIVVLEEAQNELAQLHQNYYVNNSSELHLAYKYRDILISQIAYLSAMLNYSNTQHKSRGGALYYDASGFLASERFPEYLRYSVIDNVMFQQIQEIKWNSGNIEISWRDPRPIPNRDFFFEDVWREFRNRLEAH